MKIIKFLLSLALLLGVLHFLNYPATVGGESIPPLGHFFNPFEGFWQNAEPAADFGEAEKIELPERKGSVKILFDERMVPHIFAENLEDAVFAQGYVVARFRLWQMDMLSRLSAGRLSEVLGEKVLETDKKQRRKGMLYGAQKAAESWQKNDEMQRLLQAYADGVNAWTQNLPEAKKPLEFKLLNYGPEQWNTLKTALVKKYMDLTLCSAENDLPSSNAMQVFGPEMFRKLYPEWNPKQSPVIPRGTKWDFGSPPEKAEESKEPAAERTEPQEAIGLIRHWPEGQPPEFIGSNNWAVAGSKTASGNPILCNDPHLQLSLPSIWFEVQIHTPEMNVYGVCIPGLPGVAIGFNEQTAWGETNVGQDVADWYRIGWTDEARTKYRLDGKEKAANLVVEKYFVKNQKEPVLDTVRWTVWGPVVYEGQDEPWSDLAMRWLAHDEPNPGELMTFIDLNRGRGYNDYRNALKNWDFPAQNFAFASKNGDIALTVDGKFPLKKKQQGRFVQDGSQSENAWEGFIPKAQVPMVKNPRRGFVASNNQHSTDPNYPYYYNARSFDDYRGRYLAERLGEMKNVTAEDMQKLQNSNYSLLAEEGLTALLTSLDLEKLSEKERDIVNKLAVWDFRYEADKVEPAIFDAWWRNFYDLTFDEVIVWKDSIPMLMPEDWRLVEFIEKSPEDVIFDNQKTSEKEVAADMALAALRATISDMADNLVDPLFDWASQKNTSIMHLTRINAFSRKNIDVGGTGVALNAMKGNHGPSWRMVVELGDEVKGWGVFPGGQSGNPGSPFYDSGIEKWRKGEYNELFFMKNETDDRMKIVSSIHLN